MELTKLFEAQRILDERIVKEKGLEGKDLLQKKILSLQVELGELCNCWRGFKFWSNDQEPRTKKVINSVVCVPLREVNPLLEEYVDCLHFILSIGLELGLNKDKDFEMVIGLKEKTILEQFASLFKLTVLINNGHYENYYDLTNCFFGLGEMLGFTWEQIEQAYMDKNKTNHLRQEQGY